MKYLNSYYDRYGKLRVYVRPPGCANTPLPGEPGSLEYIDAYRKAIAGAKKRPAGAARNTLGSVASAVSLYLASAVFAALAPDTRRTRKNELERFREEYGTQPIDRLERGHVETHVSTKGQASARNCLKALAPLMAWCRSEDLVKADPTQGIKRPTSANKEGYATWPEDYVEKYRKRHPLGSKARLAFEIMVNTGAARVDAALLGRQHTRNGTLTYRRHKTNVLVEIPMLPDLVAAIDMMDIRDGLTYVAKHDGTPYTKESFGNYFRAWCNEAGIPNGYSAHGVRKYAAKIRADLGATVNQLMAWFGWLTEREAIRYTRAADRRRLAIQLGQLVNAEFPNSRPVRKTDPPSD